MLEFAPLLRATIAVTEERSTESNTAYLLKQTTPCYSYVQLLPETFAAKHTMFAVTTENTAPLTLRQHMVEACKDDIHFIYSFEWPKGTFNRI